MAEVYDHSGDNVLILDTSENLCQPLLGELLRYTELRIALALSVTTSGDTNGLASQTQTVFNCDGDPLLNRFSIGLKTRGLEIPGEDGCSFVGMSNDPSVSEGGSYYRIDSLTPSVYHEEFTGCSLPGDKGAGCPNSCGFEVTFTGVDKSMNGIQSIDVTPLPQPFLAGDDIQFNGTSSNNIIFASDAISGATTISVETEPGDAFTLLNSSLGYARKVAGHLSFGTTSTVGAVETDNFEKTTARDSSFFIEFPTTSEMVASPESTLFLLKIKANNKGLSSQTFEIGYDFIKNTTDHSITNLKTQMTNMVEKFTTTQALSVKVPDALFIRWPFDQSRLRIHSMAIQRFS